MSRLSIDAFPFLHGGHYLAVSVHREFSCRRLTGLCHRTVSWSRLVRCWVMRSVTVRLSSWLGIGVVLSIEIVSDRVGLVNGLVSYS